ncbi:hypothetical protein IWX46DRAFT_266392 [Phyllosticta citricarpa]|uniref:Uncharacterized protein n=1 Tax=Phyllosticta citricarpa TaxID=55181 RepID=A0ABR1LN48_9PEZI
MFGNGRALGCHLWLERRPAGVTRPAPLRHRKKSTSVFRGDSQPPPPPLPSQPPSKSTPLTIAASLPSLFVHVALLASLRVSRHAPLDVVTLATNRTTPCGNRTSLLSQALLPTRFLKRNSPRQYIPFIESELLYKARSGGRGRLRHIAEQPQISASRGSSCSSAEARIGTGESASRPFFQES